ncbi:MAG: hypothetical protein LC128_07970 [Chitinophagales bacterium]|nr:hypothetical protein [Chitinophagales bacterium]
MKNRIAKAFTTLLIFSLVFASRSELFSQDADLKTKNLSASDLKLKWEDNSKDKGWDKLMKEMGRNGFKRVAESSWGFKGVLKDQKTGKSVDVEFCVFDFYSPKAVSDKNFQTGSMIWRKIGDEVYKAYLIYPKEVSDVEKSLMESVEFYADKNNDIKKANSFGRQFRKCVNGGNHNVLIDTWFGKMKVKADCKTSCITGIVACGGVTAILELVSGGLGTPLLLATFGLCAGAACASCLTYCALGSL